MFSEKQHFYSVFISHPLLQNLEAVQNSLTGSYDEIDRIENTDIKVLHLYYQSEKAFHRIAEDPKSNFKRPKTRRIRGNSFYLYNCYLIQFKHGTHHPYYMLAAPFKPILKESIDSSAAKLKSERISFHSLNLAGVCRHFEQSKIKREITISRISFQAISSSTLRSMALFGDDVLLSEPYLRIKSYGSPSSLRLIHRTNNGDVIAINTDRLGNWSFYLKEKNDLVKFHTPLAYLHSNGLIKISYVDPREKNSLDGIDLDTE